jgi:hypothetical protein
LSALAAAVVMSALVACSHSDSRRSGPEVRVIDPEGVNCVEDGATFTCTIDASVVEASNLASIDLNDFVSGLSADGITSDSTLVLQAFGGGGYNASGDVAGGVAQTVTTVSAFQANFDTTQLFIFVGQAANAGSNGEAGGGAATIVSTVDGATEGANFDAESNLVLVAGGAGSGGLGNYNLDNEGAGGVGGTAVSTAPGDGNCGGPTGNSGAVCGSGADGTDGDQHGHHSEPGSGGGGGLGGSGANKGADGIGGQGGAYGGGSTSGWAGGYSPTYTSTPGPAEEAAGTAAGAAETRRRAARQARRTSSPWAPVAAAAAASRSSPPSPTT